MVCTNNVEGCLIFTSAVGSDYCNNMVTMPPRYHRFPGGCSLKELYTLSTNTLYTEYPTEQPTLVCTYFGIYICMPTVTVGIVSPVNNKPTNAINTTTAHIHRGHKSVLRQVYWSRTTTAGRYYWQPSAFQPKH